MKPRPTRNKRPKAAFESAKSKGLTPREALGADEKLRPDPRERLNADMDIQDHPFLTSGIGPRASRIVEKVSDGLKQPLSPAEDYVVAVLFAATEITTVIDQMAYSVDCLSGYRRPRNARKRFPTRADHVIFHVENHLIRSASLGDRCLHLVNAVFALGLPDRVCNNSTVAENDHVRGTSVDSALKQLNKVLKPKRTDRNVVIHKAGYFDLDLQEARGFFLLEQIEKDRGETEGMWHRARWIIKRKADRLVSSRKAELQKFNVKSVVAVAALFDALLPVFMSRHGSFLGGSG